MSLGRKNVVCARPPPWCRCNSQTGDDWVGVWEQKAAHRISLQSTAVDRRQALEADNRLHVAERPYQPRHVPWSQEWEAPALQNRGSRRQLDTTFRHRRTTSNRLTEQSRTAETYRRPKRESSPNRKGCFSCRGRARHRVLLFGRTCERPGTIWCHILAEELSYVPKKFLQNQFKNSGWTWCRGLSVLGAGRDIPGDSR